MNIIATRLFEPHQFLILDPGHCQSVPRLSDALEIPAHLQHPWTISLVGSGGKSSALQTLADEAVAAGQRVLISTTTRMWLPPHEIPLVQTIPDAEAIWSASKPAWAGWPAEPGKMAGVSSENLRQLASQADLVLIEADGSRGLPCKVPALHEPVIPIWSDQIVVVAGLSAVGHPIAEVAHRPELACKVLNTEHQHILTTIDLAKLIFQGYLKPLLQAKIQNIAILLNQADQVEQFNEAGQIANQIRLLMYQSYVQEGRK